MIKNTNASNICLHNERSRSFLTISRQQYLTNKNSETPRFITGLSGF